METPIKTKRKYLRTLSIAGSDSGGGAGIQADLKTFSALGCYGMSVITALTAQNTMGVTGIHAVPAIFVEEQMHAVLSDIGTDAVKIGMLYSAEMVETVVRVLKQYKVRNIVLDPVMAAQSGDRLIREDAVDAVRELLMPIADVVTPNLPEARILFRAQMPGIRKILETTTHPMKTACTNVLIKGGHDQGETSIDILFLNNGEPPIRFESKRIQTRNNHGTGCTLSSAITAYLAKGFSVKAAVERAKHYIDHALEFGARYEIGRGHGPVHHFWEVWRDI